MFDKFEENNIYNGIFQVECHDKTCTSEYGTSGSLFLKVPIICFINPNF
jgi:hypothetical protein